MVVTVPAEDPVQHMYVLVVVDSEHADNKGHEVLLLGLQAMY